MREQPAGHRRQNEAACDVHRMLTVPIGRDRHRCFPRRRIRAGGRPRQGHTAVMIWDCIDWRTYTTALRVRTAAGISSELVIFKLLEAGRLHQDLSRYQSDPVSLRRTHFFRSLGVEAADSAILVSSLRYVVVILPNDYGIGQECVVSAAHINSRFS
jgi:hypothetical protein